MKLLEFEKQKKEMVCEKDRLESIIKEKEKEMRLNTLKLKEIRQRQKQSILGTIQEENKENNK